MTDRLSETREVLGRELAELNYLLRSNLTPIGYKLASQRIGRLLRAHGEYHAAIHCAAGRISVPKFLTEDMYQAMLGAKDPAGAWHAALRAAGFTGSHHDHP